MQEAGTDAGVRDHLRRQWREEGRVRAGRACVDGPHQMQHVQLTGPVLELFGDFLPDAHEPGLLLLGQIDHLANHRQVFGLRLSATAFLLVAGARAGDAAFATARSGSQTSP